jgi:hypothetical protein
MFQYFPGIFDYVLQYFSEIYIISDHKYYDTQSRLMRIFKKMKKTSNCHRDIALKLESIYQFFESTKGLDSHQSLSRDDMAQHISDLESIIVLYRELIRMALPGARQFQALIGVEADMVKLWSEYRTALSKPRSVSPSGLNPSAAEFVPSPPHPIYH